MATIRVGQEFLGSLSDVIITSPTDNEYLAYDSVTGSWINQTGSETDIIGSYLLLDASNSPITGDLWVNANGSYSGSLIVQALSGLSNSFVYSPDGNSSISLVAGDTSTKLSTTNKPLELTSSDGITYFDKSGVNNIIKLRDSTGTDVFVINPTGSITSSQTGSVTVPGIMVIGSVVGSLIPETTNIYDLGSNTRIWKNIYVGSFFGENNSLSSDNIIAGAGSSISGSFLRIDASNDPLIGDLDFGDNNQSSVGSIEFFDAAIYIDGSIDGTLSIESDIKVNIGTSGNPTIDIGSEGTTTLGDASNNFQIASDGDISFTGTAGFDDSVSPRADVTHDLGTASLRWQVLYVQDISGATEVTFNEAGADIDFRFEGGTVIDLLQTDAGDDTVIFGGGHRIERDAKAADYTTTKADYLIAVTDTSVARTITLATASVQDGRVVIIKDESGAAGTNNITIATEGAENIDGAATATINTNYGSKTVYSDGTNWFLI